MDGIYTWREALAAEARFGGDWLGDQLEWVEVTTVGDAEARFLAQTPRCAYCGQLQPRPRCEACGASVVRDGRDG
jgi:hypothetical protein